MLVRLLGPVEVVVDGAVRTPAGKRERALVALLALTPGETVAADRSPPGSGVGWCLRRAALDALVDRVRADSAGAALESRTQRAATGRRRRRRRRRSRCERLATGAREQARQPAALEALDRSTRRWVWRGPVLSGVEDVPFARAGGRAARASYGSACVEERFELLLPARAGTPRRSRSCAPPPREHPTRERLWGQLMTALHVEHRSQEALEVYAEARAVLADELGIEPGEALQRIEAAILLEDARAATPSSATRRCRAKPRACPCRARPTFGRDELVDSHRAQPRTTRTPGWSR